MTDQTVRTDQTETPAQARARLRAARGAAAASAAQEQQAARAAALDEAVEAELDLRAGGCGRPETPAWTAAKAALAAAMAAECAATAAAESAGAAYRATASYRSGVADSPTDATDAPLRDAAACAHERACSARSAARAAEASEKVARPQGRLARSVDTVGAFAALTDGLPATVARLLRDACARTVAEAVPHAPCAPDRRGRGGRWLRQHGVFLRARAELAVGAYAYGENGSPRSTETGIVLGLRTVDEVTSYYDVASKSVAGQHAIDAYAAAADEVRRLADEREAAELAQGGGA